MLRNDGDHAGHNDGHVRFTDVTGAAGDTTAFTVSHTLLWAFGYYAVC